MNVGELLEMLEGEEPDMEVRLAMQPSWPLRFQVDRVVNDAFIDRDEDDEDGDEGPQFIWIVAGDHPYGESPYASKKLWEV